MKILLPNDIKYLQEISKKISTFVPKIFEESLLTKYKTLQYKLIKHDWIIPPSTKKGVLLKIITEYNSAKKSKKNINRIMINSFKEKNYQTLYSIKQKISKKPIYKKRKKQISKTIDSLIELDRKNMDITSLIPAFIIQIDSLLIDFTKIKRLKYNREYKTKEGDGRIDKLYKYLSQNHSENEEIIEIIYNSLFQSSNEISPKQTFNRHNVIHGKTSNFGPEENLYKLVALLDKLSTVK